MANNFDFLSGIQQTTGLAVADIQNIFGQIAEQQKRDFALAENALMNIEAIQNATNEYGEKAVKEKANKLLADLSKSISSKGKLDYAQYGSLKAGIADLAQEKKGWDTFSKLKTEYLQFGAQNKENLYSFDKLNKELNEIANDPTSIKNAGDLRSKMQNVYENNFNWVKGVAADLSKLTPMYDKTGFIDKDGTREGYKAKLMVGTTVDANGNIVIENTDTFYDEAVAKLENSNSYAYQLAKKQLGDGASSRDIVEQVMSYMPKGEKTTISLKSSEEVRRESALATTAEIGAKSAQLEYENLPEKLRLEAEARRVSIERDKAYIKYQNDINNMQEIQNSVLCGEKDCVGDLGTEIKTVVNFKDGGDKSVYVRNILYDKATNSYKLGYRTQEEWAEDKDTIHYAYLPAGKSLTDTKTGSSLWNAININRSNKKYMKVAAILNQLDANKNAYIGAIQQQGGMMDTGTAPTQEAMGTGGTPPSRPIEKKTEVKAPKIKTGNEIVKIGSVSMTANEALSEYQNLSKDIKEITALGKKYEAGNLKVKEEIVADLKRRGIKQPQIEALLNDNTNTVLKYINQRDAVKKALGYEDDSDVLKKLRQ